MRNRRPQQQDENECHPQHLQHPPPNPRDYSINLIAWLGSSTNGITNFFAQVGHFNEADVGKLCTKKSDGTEVCASGDQLAAILAATAVGTPSSGVASGGTGGSPTGATSGPPTITINGDNPATIQVGSTYADLGATITGPTADLNLGLTTLLDGATTTQLTLDTSKPGEHTILYTVTDPNGLTDSATRTVIISAPANDNPQPQGAEQSSHDGNAATNTPPAANDNTPIAPLAATGTDAATGAQ